LRKAIKLAGQLQRFRQPLLMAESDRLLLRKLCRVRITQDADRSRGGRKFPCVNNNRPVTVLQQWQQVQPAATAIDQLNGDG